MCTGMMSVTLLLFSGMCTGMMSVTLLLFSGMCTGMMSVTLLESTHSVPQNAS
jgi:hypothetical protein